MCPQAKDDVCTVGDLLTTQSEELVAAARVTDSAPVGEKVTLTATVKASKATAAHAEATIDVVSASTPTPSASASSSVGELSVQLHAAHFDPSLTGEEDHADRVRTPPADHHTVTALTIKRRVSA